MSQTPTVKIDGTALRDDVAVKLERVRIERSIRRAGCASLRFLDEDFSLIDGSTFQLGAKLTVQFHTENNSLTSAFEGQITTLGMTQDHDGGQPILEVAAHDASHRLIAASTFKAYLNQSPADIVREIAGRHGLSAEIVGGGTSMPYTVQTGSDHHFIGQLATMLGHEWFTTGTTLHFRPRPTTTSGPTLKYSASLLRFSASYSGMTTPTAVTVHAWDVSQKKSITGTAGNLTSSPDPMVLGSNAPFVVDQHEKARSAFGRELTVSSTTAFDGPEADALAGSIARRLIGSGLRVEGTAYGDPAIEPGGTVTIAEVGTKLAGAYYVTDVTHEFGPGHPVLTHFSAGGHDVETETLTGSLGSGSAGARLPGDLTGWGQTGLMIAVVTNANDPQKLGRVKVSFPSLGDVAESDWARVILPGGGGGRGLDLRPEVDDEVIVGFDRGDPRVLFVLGGVFNGKDKPFDDGVVVDGTVQRRVLASRAGHAITLSDADDAAKRFVEIKLADDKTKVTIGEKGITIEAAKGMPLALKTGGASLTLTDDEKLVIKAKEVTVTSDGNLSLKASQAVTIKGSTGAKIDGGTAFEAKGANAKVEGSAMTTIKGGMVKIN